MRLRHILAIVLMIMLPLAGEAQKKQPEKAKTKKTDAATKRSSAKAMDAPRPVGAAKDYRGDRHLYYPDYYAFYDPNRGYVYWNMATNSWATSREVPPFMKNVDLPRTRVQILKGLSLDLYPERNYPNYMKLYPAQGDNADVPVPNHRSGAPR